MTAPPERSTVGDGIVGREAELAAIEAWLDDGRASTLLIEGEAGIGKTALWLEAVAAARERGCRVLEARPSEAEARMAYGGVADLFAPVVEEVLEELPEPQADAFRFALLLDRPGDARTSERAVRAAVLSALRALAASRPVVVAVDDAHWLDAPSAAALDYAWRRLAADERAGLLVTVRTGASVPRGPTADDRLEVQPMSMGAVHRLLRSRLGLVLSRPALRRLHDVAAGNPFFSLELGRALQRAGGAPAPGTALPVPRSLRELIDDRLASLPEATREALELASALSRPTLELVTDAARGEEPLRAALDAGVLELDRDRLRFAHPLVAAVVYEGMHGLRRREVHRRLAMLVEDEEEHARHLAMTAQGPDESVAAALERAAEHAAGRGATAAAADLAAQAHTLTPQADTASMRRRMFAEADYATRAGDPQRAGGLLQRLLSFPLSSSERGAVLVQLGRVAMHGLDWRSSVHHYLDALAHADPALGAAIELDVVRALSLLEEGNEALRHMREAARLAEAVGDEPLLVTALLGLETAERGAPSRVLIERFLALDAPPAHFGPGSTYAFVLGLADRFAEGLAYYELMRRYALDHGEEAPYSWTLVRMAQLECFCGAWRQALAHAEEAVSVALQAGHVANEALALATRALVEAHLGRIEHARASAARALELAEPIGGTHAATFVCWALAFLDLSLGDARAAHVRLGPVVAERRRAGVQHPSLVRFVPDEIEALVETGNYEAAAALLDWYEGRARAAGRPFSLAAAARSGGLLAAARGNVDGALEAFEEALVEHERVDAPFERARALLARGSVLRRANRRRAARHALDEALAEFERLGAAVWTGRARQELARIGGRPPATGELTPSERRVAELVAEGKTNREVAAALFLTERTVETHLTHVYGKLGVRSRTELARHFNAS